MFVEVLIISCGVLIAGCICKYVYDTYIKKDNSEDDWELKASWRRDERLK